MLRAYHRRIPLPRQTRNESSCADPRAQTAKIHGLTLYTGGEVNVHKKRGRSARAESGPRQSDPGTGLGRPRDERIDAEVVSAVLNTLKNEGYGAVTIE